MFLLTIISHKQNSCLVPSNDMITWPISCKKYNWTFFTKLGPGTVVIFKGAFFFVVIFIFEVFLIFDVDFSFKVVNNFEVVFNFEVIFNFEVVFIFEIVIVFRSS